MKDAIKGENFDSGTIILKFPENSDVSLIENYGNTKHIEEVFEKHRLEKVNKSQSKYREKIMEDLFVMGQEILVPQCIRDYFRGIDNLDNNKKKYFRNSSRLYNKSILLGVDESSLQIALFSSKCLKVWQKQRN